MRVPLSFVKGSGSLVMVGREPESGRAADRTIGTLIFDGFPPARAASRRAAGRCATRGPAARRGATARWVRPATRRVRPARGAGASTRRLGRPSGGRSAGSRAAGVTRGAWLFWRTPPKTENHRQCADLYYGNAHANLQGRPNSRYSRRAPE